MTSRRTSLVLSSFVKLSITIALLSLIPLTACERRKQLYSGIDPSQGSAESSEAIDPHKKY